MSEIIEQLVQRIVKLEDEIERLKTGDGIGVWTSWTPVITYSGGSTDPDTLTATAVYLNVGEIVYFAIYGSLTRDTGDRTTIKFSVPTAHDVIAPSAAVSAYHNLTGAVSVASNLAIVAVDELISMALGAAMSNDGSYRISGFYRIA